MSPAILAASLLASLAWASTLPSRDVQVSYGARASGLVPISPRGIERRSDHNRTFDLGWRVQDQPLFSANWTGGTGYIPIGGPVESSLTESFSLSIECNDCRTFGTILADFNDDSGLNMSLTFNNVGLYMDFGVFSSQKGTFTIGLGRFFGKKPAGQNIKQIFNATVGIGIDLVLSFTGDVKATGGFQIAIPDKEKIGLVLDLPDQNDLLAGNFNVTAGLDLVPTINFALLPTQLRRSSANITAALILRAEAGIGLQKTPVTQDINFSALVAASLTLAELTFGTVVTDGSHNTCKQALFVDVDASAGAEAVVGGELAGHEFERGPDVGTIFLTAGTTRCLDHMSGVETRGIPTPPLPTSTLVTIPGCPTSALVTETTDVTNTVSLTSCMISAINCPASLTQVVIVTAVQPTTIVSCPASFNLTTPTATVEPVPFYTAGSINMPPLKVPVVTSIAPEILANATAPVNATVVGVSVTVPVLTTPPPEATQLVGVGGNNGTAATTTSTGAVTGRVSARGGLMGLFMVFVGVVVLL